jgi:hypothetical protein
MMCVISNLINYTDTAFIVWWWEINRSMYTRGETSVPSILPRSYERDRIPWRDRPISLQNKFQVKYDPLSRMLKTDFKNIGSLKRYSRRQTDILVIRINPFINKPFKTHVHKGQNQCPVRPAMFLWTLRRWKYFYECFQNVSSTFSERFVNVFRTFRQHFQNFFQHFQNVLSTFSERFVNVFRTFCFGVIDWP